MFTPNAAQDFDPAFHAANGCTARSCDVVADHKDAEGQLGSKDGLRGNENEAGLEKEEHNDCETMVKRTISKLVAFRDCSP